MTTIPDDSELADWATRQSSDITGDPLWRLDAYRHAAYVAELARRDAEALAGDTVRAGVAAQLLTAAASIPANIAEGYGRPTTPDRIRYLSYALGSGRETCSWYDATRGALVEEHRAERLARLSRLRRILLGLLSHLRTRTSKPFDRW
jgi:four helix bundle protein